MPSVADAEALAWELLAPLADRWAHVESSVADALWMVDLTTGPRGGELAYDERLPEILDRYEPEPIVGRSMIRAEAGYPRGDRPGWGSSWVPLCGIFVVPAGGVSPSWLPGRG